MSTSGNFGGQRPQDSGWQGPRPMGAVPQPGPLPAPQHGQPMPAQQPLPPSLQRPLAQGPAPQPMQQPVPMQPAPGMPSMPVHPPAGAATGKTKRVFLSPILLILSALAAIASQFLPWYNQYKVSSSDSGVHLDREFYSAWRQAGVVLENNGTLGALMLAGLAVAILAAVLALIGALLGFVMGARKTPAILAWVAVGLGLLATIGLLLGFVSMGGTENLGYGCWLSGVSFLPALIGAIGLTSKKF